MKKLLCKLFGHNAKFVGDDADRLDFATLVECARCKEKMVFLVDPGNYEPALEVNLDHLSE